MSFIYRDRKDDDFDYGSALCPYCDGCSARNCAHCRVIESDNRKKDAQLENFYASGL